MQSNLEFIQSPPTTAEARREELVQGLLQPTPHIAPKFLYDALGSKLFEAITDEEQIHYNYFDNIRSHIEKLGDTYLAQIAGTPSSTGLTPKGFAVGGAA